MSGAIAVAKYINEKCKGKRITGSTALLSDEAVRIEFSDGSTVTIESDRGERIAVALEIPPTPPLVDATAAGTGG